MAILVGLLVGVVVFICCGLSFYAGYRIGATNKVQRSPLTASQKEENETVANIQKSYAQIMRYDVDKAIERKQVT